MVFIQKGQVCLESNSCTLCYDYSLLGCGAVTTPATTASYPRRLYLCRCDIEFPELGRLHVFWQLLLAITSQFPPINWAHSGHSVFHDVLISSSGMVTNIQQFPSLPQLNAFAYSVLVFFLFINRWQPLVFCCLSFIKVYILFIDIDQKGAKIQIFSVMVLQKHELSTI